MEGSLLSLLMEGRHCRVLNMGRGSWRRGELHVFSSHGSFAMSGFCESLLSGFTSGSTLSHHESRMFLPSFFFAKSLSV